MEDNKIKQFEESKTYNYKTQKEITFDQMKTYFLQQMQEIVDKDGDDEEQEHIDADQLLCDLLEILGFEELIKLYHKIDKWYA